MALCRVAAASCPLSGAVHTGAHIDLTPYTLPALCAARRSGHHVPPPPPPPPTDQPSLPLPPSLRTPRRSVRPTFSAQHCNAHCCTALHRGTASPRRPLQDRTDDQTVASGGGELPPPSNVLISVYCTTTLLLAFARSLLGHHHGRNPGTHTQLATPGAFACITHCSRRLPLLPPPPPPPKARRTSFVFFVVKVGNNHSIHGTGDRTWWEGGFAKERRRVWMEPKAGQWSKRQ